MFFSSVQIFLVFIFLLVLPGYFVLKVFFPDKKLYFLERFFLATPLSIAFLFIISLILNLFSFGIGRSSILVSYLIFFLALAVFSLFIKNKEKKSKKNYFKLNFVLFLTLFLIIFLRVVVFYHDIVPSATDLAHHTFWANEIIKSGHIPEYGKPDFIAGEHLILAVPSMFSGISLISVLGIIILFLVNLSGILATFVFAKRLFKSDILAIISLFFVGVLYPYEAPQASSILGGVVGNVLGNALIPLSLYFFYRGLTEKSPAFFNIFMVSALALGISHHLSMFLFLIIFSFFVLIHIIFNILSLKNIFKEWVVFFKNPFFVATIILIVLFLFFVYNPYYLKSGAVSTVLRPPTFRVAFGVKLGEYPEILGYFRALFGIVGIIFIIKTIKNKKFAKLLVIFWTVPIFLISWIPNIFRLDLPSGRVANYLVYPLSIISAFGVVCILRKSKKIFSPIIFFLIGVVLIGIPFIQSLNILINNFDKESRDLESSQVHNASSYLQKEAKCNDRILSDHVWVTGDQWIKVYFNCGFDYVVSRFDKFRYEPPFNYDPCSLEIVQRPNSLEGRACFKSYGAKYFLLDSREMSKDFSENSDFNKIYQTNNLTLWYYGK